MKIKMKLSQESIDSVISRLESYNKSLDRKVELFIDRLSKIGIEAVQQTMESVPNDDKGTYYTEIVRKDGGVTGATIRLSGNKVLFIEFSAGITYGTSDYPTPAGAGYGMGTYPSQKEKSDWDNPHGWWYTDDGGNKHHSYGNRAYMPMYHGEEAIILAIKSVAKEIFGTI